MRVESNMEANKEENKKKPKGTRKKIFNLLNIGLNPPFEVAI